MGGTTPAIDTVLDIDGDEMISGEEIANAAAALFELDADYDGGPPGGGPPGGPPHGSGDPRVAMGGASLGMSIHKAEGLFPADGECTSNALIISSSLGR